VEVIPKWNLGTSKMADRISYNIMRENFRELARAAEHRSKVILTCRTQYFKDRQEQVKTIGEGLMFKETETELYQDQRQYGTRQQVVYLELFDDEKIKAYLQRTRPEHVAEDWDKIEHIYDIRGLAERPVGYDCQNIASI
jgi:glutamine synthetase adenylyltransferase